MNHQDIIAHLRQKYPPEVIHEITTKFPDLDVQVGGGIRDEKAISSLLELGQHLVLPKDTPLCNVWLTMLQGLGINAPRHGDSTGVVKELQA